ncbi:MAG: hypothetical protein NDJ75_04870, partial [Thermoanaerobaculia bacterium]|nr:hypothetical protein [Thermoanaerobaculia bacterium]
MPTQDPDARHLRRFGRDLAELERRRRDGAPAGTDRPGDALDDAPPRALAGWSEEELEQIPTRAKHGGRRAAEARRRANRLVAEAAPASAATTAATPRLGSVIATSRGPCEVELDDGAVVRAQLPKALARDDRGVLAVGDRVEVAARPSGDLAVTRRLPRASRLSRPDPTDPRRERVLVANLELGVVVASSRRPALSPG